MTAMDDALAEVNWPPDMPNDERRREVARILLELQEDIRAMPWYVRPIMLVELYLFRRGNGYQ